MGQQYRWGKEHPGDGGAVPQLRHPALALLTTFSTEVLLCIGGADCPGGTLDRVRRWCWLSWPRGMLLAFRRWRPGVLLNRLQHMRQSPRLPPPHRQQGAVLLPTSGLAAPRVPWSPSGRQCCPEHPGLRRGWQPTRLCSSGAQGASSDHPAPCRQEQPSPAGLTLRPAKVRFS